MNVIFDRSEAQKKLLAFKILLYLYERCGRNADYPTPPPTVPDVRFSRIRFLGCTRFRVGLSQRNLMKTSLFRRFRSGCSRVFKHPLEFVPIIAFALIPAIQPFLRILDNLAVKRPY